MKKIKVKTLSEELQSFFDNNPEKYAKISMLQAWPAIAGPQLSAVTELKSTTDGVLTVFTTSASAKSLLLMRKEQIIRDFNKMFPEAKINRILITKRA